MNPNTRSGVATALIHQNEGGIDKASPLTTPIYETTTFVFDTAVEVQQYQEGKSDRYLYSRYENPTVVATERTLAVIEGADAAMVLSSGMAATSTALLGLLAAGDEVICASAIYGGTSHLINDLLTRFGVRARFPTLDELVEDPESLFRPGGAARRVFWFESPVNPTLRCLDIGALAAACRRHNVISVIDNTFASPCNQEPLRYGVDLVMHSATKYLNGHSDVTGGVLAGPKKLIEQLRAVRKLLGGVLDPQAAYALGRGLKTLPLRMAQHNANAHRIAEFLEADRRVVRTFYPGLASHPDHEIARRQMSGFGGMICFEVDGGLAGASAVFDRLRVIKRAASLGGLESLASLPVLTSHYGYSDESLSRIGVTSGMIRLSVGLEDVSDLIEDLDQALGR